MNECTPKEVTRMMRGKGRFVNRPGYGKDKKYPKYYVYVPVNVAEDTAFPFKVGDEVEIVIDLEHKRLVIEKASAQSKNESKK